MGSKLAFSGLALVALLFGCVAEAQERPGERTRPAVQGQSRPKSTPETRSPPEASKRATPRGRTRPAEDKTPDNAAEEEQVATPEPAPPAAEGPTAGATEPSGTVVPSPAPGSASPATPSGGSVVDALTGKDLYHGNFCGVGRRGEGSIPVDALDESCKRHDDCYDISGHRACTCDRQLKREALAIANGAQFEREIRARAGAIAQAAELMSCVGP